MSEQTLAEYVLITGPHPVLWVEQPVGFSEPAARQTENMFHGFRAARIPYLPTSENLKSAQNPDFFSRELFRRFNFLAEAVAGLDPRDGVALRIFNHPLRARQHPHLEIWLMVKSAPPNAEEARQAVNGLWQVMRHAFPSEFPFNFPLEPISSRDIELQSVRWVAERVRQVVEIQKTWEHWPNAK